MNGSESPDTMASFTQLLRNALGDNLAPNATTFLEMIDKDGVMEFPYFSTGPAHRLEGRNAVANHIKNLGGMIEISVFCDLVVHESKEAGTFILEFNCEVRGVATGLPYNQRYISVITLKDGHITRYLDYWNPLVLQQAMSTEGKAATGEQS